MDTALDLARERIRAATATATATATANRRPLRIRGGGSKDFYGRSLQGDLLDTTALSGIVSYEPSELVVTARAGTPLAELEALLAAQNQYLPFEPPQYRSAIAAIAANAANAANGPAAAPGATVGGMVAAGLSGPARASAGSVRDHVLGVTLLNGRAELLSFGGQVIKNVAGYDLSRLMAGAMGSLGLLVNISLKVLPLPPAEATLVFESSQAEALAQLHRWGGLPLPLNASCWVQDNTAGQPGTGTGAELLFVRLRGAVAAVASASRQMLADVPAAAKPRQMDTAQAAADWRLCRDQQLPFFTQAPGPEAALWRLSVAQTAAVLDLPWPQLVEWHGGQRWLWAPLSAAARLRVAAAQAGGHATVFRAPAGVDAANLEVFAPLPSPLDRIHRQLKAEFDPAGIFNPGRLYPEL